MGAIMQKLSLCFIGPKNRDNTKNAPDFPERRSASYSFCQVNKAHDPEGLRNRLLEPRGHLRSA